MSSLRNRCLAAGRRYGGFFWRTEIAPLEERNAHRLEELRTHPEQLAGGVLARWWSVAWHFDAIAGGRHAVERGVTRYTGRTRSRQRFHPRKQLFVHARLLRDTETVAGLNLEDHNILPVKAGVQTLELLQAAHKQPRADQ